MKKLCSIAIPSWRTKEFAYLVVLTALLIVRTWMSIWLSEVNGRVVRAIINRSLTEFAQRVSSSDAAALLM